MLILLLVIVGVWLVVFSACAESLIWQFRWTAFSALCFTAAGLRLVIQGPWERVDLSHVTGGPPQLHAAKAIAEAAHAVGPQIVGVIMLLIAAYLASGAKAMWGLHIEGRNHAVKS